MIYIKFYIISRIILSIIWIILLIKNRKNIILFKKDYVLFLCQKWKIIIFLWATTFLSYISTLWFDPSWDIPETIIMSIMTFYFSPYSVWIIYRYFKWFHNSKTELYIAIILLFFTSCWFYDAYATLFLLWHYPPMAFSNIWLSPFFYTFAGMLWSLDYSKEKWVVFVYALEEWISFKWEKNIFPKIFIWTLPMIGFMLFIFLYFIWINL